MSVLILNRPIKSSCNWNAAGNPVIYKMYRADAVLSFVNDNGGFTQFQINAVDLTSYFEVGNTVGTVSDSYVTGVVTASAFSAGNTFVTIDLPYGYFPIAENHYALNNLSKLNDYKLHVDFKSSISPNPSLLNDVLLSLTHGLDGFIYVDASILKSHLSPDWTLPSVINEEDENAYLPFYISYQEYYDGALQGSVTNDTGNVIYLVHGANQIGWVDGSNMLAFYPGSTSKKWLTSFVLSIARQGLTVWRDWPFTISFIWPGNIATMNRYVVQYGVDGGVTATSEDAITPTLEKLNRLKLPDLNAATVRLNLVLRTGTVTVSNSTFDSALAPWTSVDTGLGAPDPWTYDSGGGGRVVATVGGDPNNYSEALTSPTHTTVANGSDVSIEVVVETLGTGNLELHLYDGGSWVLESTVTIPVGSNIITFEFSAPFDFDQYRLLVQSGTSPEDFYISSSRLGNGISNKIQDIEVNVEDACDYEDDNTVIPWTNPVMLVWRNSLGGDACWLFQKFHEFTYSYQNGRKAPRLILMATDLTPVQWQAIQELNTVGEVYNENIVDLGNTNTINKTSRRVGASVYMIDQDGNKTGVVVIPQTEKVQSRNVTHSIAIEIELPEIQSV